MKSKQAKRDFRNLRRKISAVIAVVFVCVSFFSAVIYADQDACSPGCNAPTPSERVLLIYTNCTTYNPVIKDYFKASLLAISPAPVVDELLISSGNTNGFYDELVAQYFVTNLNQWCQVYDLRFRDDKNNIAYTGQAQEDVITYTGANSDTDLYDAYLSVGGSVYFQAEHHDYYIKNSNLIMYLDHIAKTPTNQASDYVNLFTGDLIITGFAAVPESFNTDFNTLVSCTASYVGGISLVNIGSARPLVTADFGASGGMSALFMAYLPADLKTGGRVVAGFESNIFGEPVRNNATTQGLIQNIYDLLGGCLKSSMTKFFTAGNVTSDASGSFIISYENVGNRTINNVTVWDTIPGCLSFQSSLPAPSGSLGNFYWWNLGGITPTVKEEITVQYNAVSMPPCP